MAASCGQPRQLRPVPRGARTGRGPDGETWSLAALLHWLARIDGVARLRYTTSHPRDMSDDLIEAPLVRSLGGEVKIMPLVEGHSTTDVVRTILERYVES